MVEAQERERARIAGELHDDAVQVVTALGPRERAELAGGSVTITSRPGSGTTVVVRLPVEANRST